MRTFLLVVALIVFAVAVAPAAQARTTSDHQLWASTTVLTRPLTSLRLLGWLDLHDRKREDSTLLILRPAVGHQLMDRLAVYAGYAWLATYADEGANRHEHRTWQQLVWNAPVPQGWALSLRPRLEQRFAQGGNDTGHRVRVSARGAYAPHPAFMIVAWDEFFYQINNTDWGASSGFDQNRAFLGLGLPTTSTARVEVGYLNVFLKRSPDNHLDHNLAINLFWTH